MSAPIKDFLKHDTTYCYTNDNLPTLLKDLNLENTKDNLQNVFDGAFLACHPYIYEKSDKTPSPKDYGLNFLWLNLNPQDRVQNVAQNIFQEGLDPLENSEFTDPQSFKTYTYRLFKWAKTHPESEATLWYDSALVTEKARDNTLHQFQKLSASEGVNLKLRDIRHIPSLQADLSVTLHPGVPVYYRVDLCKAAILDYLTDPNLPTPTYCVVSDIDVEPMPAEQLFDKRTLDFLEDEGYVFNRVDYVAFENSFTVFKKGKEELRNIHNKTILIAAAKLIELTREWASVHLKVELIKMVGLHSNSIYKQYTKFQEQMDEGELFYSRNLLDIPRKIAKCPTSQFAGGGDFTDEDHKAEAAYFLKDYDTPYTINGRNFGKPLGPIENLKDWKAEPLS